MSNNPLIRSEVGLPEKGELVRVLHSREAAKTVVELRESSAPLCHRLYWRAASSTMYCPLGQPSGQQSFEHATSCDAPYLFFTGVEWITVDEQVRGSHMGIFRATLGETPTVDRLNLDDILPSGATVHRVLRASDAGTRLDALVAVRVGTPNEFEVRRVICLLDLEARECRKMDDLPGFFF
jgi:hypothetical protein